MNEPSEAYQRALAATQAHHGRVVGKTFSGAFLFKHRKHVAETIARYRAESLLDYGCGWGKQYTDFREDDTGDRLMLGRDKGFENGKTLAEVFGIDPYKYDPGVPHYAEPPPDGSKFDGVVCIQVLGCIPTADLPWVINRMYGFATKFLFVVERVGFVPRKPIFEHMAEEMPHGTTAEGWLERLRRPGSPVRLILKTRDQESGIWETFEPTNQGKAK